MKKSIYILGLIFFFSFSGLMAVSAEKPSCYDLSEIADDLDDISDEFSRAGTIREGDKIDKALGELVDALTEIAEIENEGSLTNAVNSLIEAYNKMDSEKFKLSIDSVIMNMDRLYRRDCRK